MVDTAGPDHGPDGQAAGEGGGPPGEHYEAAAFADMNRLARQRAVIAALGDIVGQRVHAVAIKADAPAA
jgi:BolA protein